MRKAAAASMVIAAIALSGCGLNAARPNKSENCGQIICAHAWAQCKGKQPVITLYVSAKNESETPIKYTYRLFGSNGQVTDEGPGSEESVRDIFTQDIPFSGESTKVHALSGSDDIAIPAAVSVTC